MKYHLIAITILLLAISIKSFDWQGPVDIHILHTDEKLFLKDVKITVKKNQYLISIYIHNKSEESKNFLEFYGLGLTIWAMGPLCNDEITECYIIPHGTTDIIKITFNHDKKVIAKTFNVK